MKKTNFWSADIRFLSEEEISEKVFKNLLTKEKFSILFLEPNTMYHLLFDREFQNALLPHTIFVPSSKFIASLVGNLKESNNVTYVKESSAIFRSLRHISDYHYRILLIDSSDKIVSRFKKNINSSIRGSSLNIIGIHNIYTKKHKNQKIETIRKIEPDIAIVGDNVIKFIKLIHKDRELLKNSSLIFSNSGVKIIAGSFGIKTIFSKAKRFLESVMIFLWFLKERILITLRGKKWK
ncbi:MAG: WecB/TagA/CpsF family glycosyltransferase [Brevinematia bacterium]